MPGKVNSKAADGGELHVPESCHILPQIKQPPQKNAIATLKFAMTTAANLYYCHFELRSHDKQKLNLDRKGGSPLKRKNKKRRKRKKENSFLQKGNYEE